MKCTFLGLSIVIGLSEAFDTNLIHRIIKTYNITTIFCLNNENSSFPVFPEIPVIQLRTIFPVIKGFEFFYSNMNVRKVVSIRHPFQLSEHYKDNILTILKVESSFESLITSLKDFLDKIFHTKIVVFLENSEDLIPFREIIRDYEYPKKLSFFKIYNFIDLQPCSYINEYEGFTNFIESYSPNIIFPLAKTIKQADKFHLPFDSKTWSGTLIIFLLIGILRKWFISNDLITEIMQSFKFALGQGISNTSGHRNWPIQSLTIFYGFLISTLYLNMFGNINQFDNVKVISIKSLISRGIEVLGCPIACQYPWFKDMLPKGLNINFNKTVDNFSLDFAYYLPAGMYENFQAIQSYKEVKLFGVIEGFPKPNQIQHFAIKRNSMFKEAVNMHILWAYSAGLPNKWKTDVAGIYWKLDLKLNKFQVFDVDLGVVFDKFDIYDFMVHFGILGGGVILGFVTLCGEIVFKKCF